MKNKNNISFKTIIDALIVAAVMLTVLGPSASIGLVICVLLTLI